MNIRLISHVASATMIVVACVTPVSASSDEVLFTSHDGSWQIMGVLKSYKDTVFEIATELGPLTLSSKSVICGGTACPPHAQIWADIYGLRESEDATFLQLLKQELINQD